VAKGFKDEDGKFHPTEVDPRLSSLITKNNPKDSNPNNKKAKDLKEKKQRFKQVPIFKFDEAPKEIQEKILENWREKYSAHDDFWAEDEGLIFRKDPRIDGLEIFNKTLPTHWNVGYGNRWVQFGDLEVIDNDKFAKAFGLTKELIAKVIPDFDSEPDQKNTKLQFRDVNGNKIDFEVFDEKQDAIVKNTKYRQSTKKEEFQNENFWLVEPEDTPTTQEWQKLLRAMERFDQLMDQSAENLERNYEGEFDDGNIKETIRINEYDFNEQGEIEPS